MLINKVYNNNVVLSKDEHENDIVIMGRGIAFQKKRGDTIESDKVEKVFHQVNEGMQHRLADLLYEIPLEYFSVTEEIIQTAKLKLGKKMNGSIVISLTDHLFYAVQRYKEGQVIRNGLLWEIKRLYKEEFELGKHAVEIINNRYNLEMPEDEAAFIALHLINAQLDEEMPMVMSMTKVMKGVLEIVRMHFMIQLDEESLSYHRFVTHLKFFSQRLVHGNLYNESDDVELYEFIKRKYPDSFSCTEKIVKYVQKEFDYSLTSEEMLYISVHIQRLIKKSNQ